MQLNPDKPESKLASLGKMFVAPLFAAFMGFMGSYIGIQKDISTVSTAIVSMSADIKDLKQKQEALYKDYYLPNRVEWNTQADKISRVLTEHDEMRRQLQIISEDMRRINHADPYTSTRRIR